LKAWDFKEELGGKMRILGRFLFLLVFLRLDSFGAVEDGVVMIRSVVQDYDYRMPWKQKGMEIKVGSGFVIEGKRVLTNAHNVANAKYVELRKEKSAKRFPAFVKFIGHDCDLALLVPFDSDFFDGTAALRLGGIPAINSKVSTYGFPVGGNRVSVTEGVVSRIETDIYVLTGADKHLVVQTDAAINPGNSGGPVVQNGKVVGVAFQGLRQAENIGYMIPTTVIRHFLMDIEDGRYDGFGSLGFTYNTALHNPSYRKFLKVPEGIEGVVVEQVLLDSSVSGILKREDVITRIGGYKIDNDGMIRMYGLRVDFSEAIEQKQLGEEIEIEFYRKGIRKVANVEVALNRTVLDYARRYDKPPSYFIYAGLVFTPLTRNLLETWGRNWIRVLPNHLRYLFAFSTELNQDPLRKEYVLLSEILSDPVNAYASSYKNFVLESINDMPIRSLKDIPKALAKTKKGFCVFRFMDKLRPLVIEAKRAEERGEKILQTYNVPKDHRFEEENQ